MPKSVRLPHPLSILCFIIVFAAALTWLVPAGSYDSLSYSAERNVFLRTTDAAERELPATQATLDSLSIPAKAESFRNGAIRKPVPIPGTYHHLEAKRQGVLDAVKAPLRGIADSIDVILFVLVIGGFIRVFNSTGAMQEGLRRLSVRMGGRESWLIVILTFLFAFGGSSYGMAEEGLAFYPVLIPLFLAAGYDVVVPVAIVFGGTQLGTLSSFSNPFSTIIASNAAGISWTDGLVLRLLTFVLSAAIMIWYITRYAERVKKNPVHSFAYRSGEGSAPVITGPDVAVPKRTTTLLCVFLAAFVVMIGGVIFLEWWLLEMTAVFFVWAIVVAVLAGQKESAFIGNFLAGASDMLGVAFIIGAARGIGVVLDDGAISQSIVYYAAQLIGDTPPIVFVLTLMVLYMCFNLFIPSSSGMAVATMPIMGSLAVVAGVPGKDIVNAYLFGMGIMGFIAPTGLILPSLALAGLNYRAWFRFCWPLLLILFALCACMLLAGTLS